MTDKHLQLGADPAHDDRTEVDDAAKDALWADACTVDEFADQLERLAYTADPLEQWELARLRNEGAG